MSFLNPGFPVAHGSPTATFGAENTGPDALVVPVVLIVAGVWGLSRLGSPSGTPTASDAMILERMREARALQAKRDLDSDSSADAYFAARVKNDNRREAQKARLEKWKSSL